MVAKVSKQEEFQGAMDRYHQSFVYRNVGYVVSACVLALQVLASTRVGWTDLGMVSLLAVAISFVAADFVNGMVHMVMDNNDNYTSSIGPLVAIFHLHHNRPQYKDQNIFAVYFIENGMKNWLAAYMAIVFFSLPILPSALGFGLFCFGIWSSVAECSHYLCHNSKHPFVRILQRSGVLLDPSHHQVHHDKDNVRYAFLNGCTDPLLDAIALRAFPGYASTTDEHSRQYFEG